MATEQPCIHSRYDKNKCKHHFERKQREDVNPGIYIPTCKISVPTQCSASIRFIKWNTSQPNDEVKRYSINKEVRPMENKEQIRRCYVCVEKPWYSFIHIKKKQAQYILKVTCHSCNQILCKDHYDDILCHNCKNE